MALAVLNSEPSPFRPLSAACAPGPWSHLPILPCWRANWRKSGRRTRSRVVGFIPKAPIVHWSKETAVVQLSLVSHLKARSLQIDGIGFCPAHTATCGCSSHAQPPMMAASHMSWTIVCSSSVPILTWRSCFRLKKGNPHGLAWSRSGLGPPGIQRAAVHVSHGGPPPTPMILLLRI